MAAIKLLLREQKRCRKVRIRKYGGDIVPAAIRQCIYACIDPNTPPSNCEEKVRKLRLLRFGSIKFGD